MEVNSFNSVGFSHKKVFLGLQPGNAKQATEEVNGIGNKQLYLVMLLSEN